MNFITQIKQLLADGKLTRQQADAIAKSEGITDKTVQKELIELSIVLTAREIALQPLPLQARFNQIVALYKGQVNLSHRTSQSIMLQQYSTPAPIAFLAGEYVKHELKGNYQILEPSAGNGLLTIAFPASNVLVNEIDELRNQNLQGQGYMKVMRVDGTTDLARNYEFDSLFDGIVTNPPFGTMDKPLTIGEYKINHLDHVMCIRALDCMKDNGRAAMIIGGHTNYDEKGRVQAGKNRIFLTYLYSHYNIEDIINIDGSLYSRQGTSFNVRLILINGRKAKPEGYPPLKNDDANPVTDFESLYERVTGLFGEVKAEPKTLREPVLRYKADGNTLTNTKVNFEPIAHLKNAYRTIEPTYIDKYNGNKSYDVILKIQHNGKTIYTEAGNYADNHISSLKQSDIDNAIKSFIEDITYTSNDIRFINSLKIELAKQFGYDTSHLERIRAEYFKKKEQDENQKKAERAEQQRIEAEKRKKRHTVMLTEALSDLKNSKQVDGEALIDLARHFSISIHPRTVSAIRKYRMSFVYSAKDESVTLYFYSKKRITVDTRFIHELLKQSFEPTKPTAESFNITEPDGYFYNGLIYVYDESGDFFPIGTSQKSVRNAITRSKMWQHIQNKLATPWYRNDDKTKRLRIAKAKAKALLLLQVQTETLGNISMIPKVSKNIIVYKDEKELKEKVTDFVKKSNYVGLRFEKQINGRVINLELTWQGLKNDINEYHPNYTEKLLSFVELPQLIKNAQYILTENDKRKRVDVKAVHKFFSKVIVGNTEFDVIIIVYETSKTYLYDHILVK